MQQFTAIYFPWPVLRFSHPSVEITLEEGAIPVRELTRRASPVCRVPPVSLNVVASPEVAFLLDSRVSARTNVGLIRA